MNKQVFALLVFSLNIPIQLGGQETPPPQEGAPAAAQPAAGRPVPRAAGQPEIKPYDKVITKEAKSDKGVFTVHQIKNKYYYEIPRSELGKDFLWVSQIAKTTLDVGYGGQALGNRVVRWERHNDRVLLRSIRYDIVADPKEPIARAVQAANNDAILMAFNIEAFGKEDAPVIDVTRLYSTEVPEFSARSRLRARGFDAGRSFIERVVSFPENIEVQATHTYTSPTDAPTPGAPAPPTPSLTGQGMRPGSASVVMHFSMVKLPEQPMMPRLFDERVGYFSVRQLDFGKDEHRAPQRTYITRWRLEKKDPNAAVSEPVKPIVFYIDPATPTKWVPYIKSGVEKWQAAFEAAGFQKAIIAKDAPSPDEDPDWSPEDARYSVIRWLPSTVENASGPHVHDPRTGEILESDIQFYHNVMNLSRDWYFTQVSPLDSRAKKLPLPDDLMGKLIEYVAAHEVGHTLGFQHNMKASSLYPIEKIRDRDWVKKMGHTPTLMDYSRFNYVAQPEDKVDPEDLIPKIGPYDIWATVWGYKPIPGAASPEDEKPTLHEWALEQDKTPWLRFSTAKAQGSDVGELTEAVGDADAIEATRLGLKNLERVMGYLLKAVDRPGDNYDELERVYGRVLGQWALEMNHVAAIVGGFNTRQKHMGQEGLRFIPVAKDQQASAVSFLNENAFRTPSLFIDTDILRRIEPAGALNRIKGTQMRVLSNLLTTQRLARLVEQEATDGASAFKPTDLLNAVRKGVWSELAAPKVAVDPYRRNLQRGYLDLIGDKLNGRQAVTDDQRPLFRGELRTLSTEIAAAVPRATDRVTRLHLEDVRDQITKILDPKFAAPAPAGAAGAVRRALDEGAVSCWQDYGIYE
jgi:hypothetical protein